MAEQRTVPHPMGGLPIRTLKAEVVEGPDAGKALVAASEALAVGTAQGNDLLITDPTVSRYHLQLAGRQDGIEVVDLGSTNGTSAGQVRIERGVVPAGTVLRLGKTKLKVSEGGRATVETYGGDTLAGLRGDSPLMRRLMARIERAAQSDAAVLLVGESGTGKELAAAAIHTLGPRAAQPRVTVDCGSLSPTLVASELFGHERGAFTGALHRHVGAFERADGGTVFLDEVGELPATVQTTLLGVLERKRFCRVGGQEEIDVDVRIVCATHRDLRSEVNRGGFRLDLYYRIAVVTLDIPPLRDRPDDIPILVEHFLREAGYSGDVDEALPREAMLMLRAHRWPGNVRELRNVVEATLAMGEMPEMQALSAANSEGSAGSDPIAPLFALNYKDARSRLLDAFEARYLKQLLDKTQGNVSEAARRADMDRSHLNDLLRRHRLR